MRINDIEIPPKKEIKKDKFSGTFISREVNIPDMDTIMKMPLNDRIPFLEALWEKNFLDYYGKDAEKILSALEKCGNNRLLKSVPKYAMYMPDSAYGTSKTKLENNARDLFRKSAYLLEMINELSEYLNSNSLLASETKEKIDTYKDNLTNRAINILSSRFNIHQKQNEGTLWYLAQVKSIEEDLQISDEELFLNLYWFKFAKKKQPQPSIEDIISHKVQIISSNELTNSEKDELLSIYEDNWKNEKEEIKSALIDSMKKSFEKNNSEFVIIKNYKGIVGFVKFEDFGEYEFASALNIKEDYKKFGLAEALLDSSLKLHSEIKPVHARARLSLDYIRKYIEELDAFGVSIENYYGTPHLNLIFSAKEKDKFLSSRYKNIKNLDNNNILIQKLNSLEELKLPKGFNLIRTIKEKDGKINCVLEKL